MSSSKHRGQEGWKQSSWGNEESFQGDPSLPQRRPREIRMTNVPPEDRSLSEDGLGWYAAH